MGAATFHRTCGHEGNPQRPGNDGAPSSSAFMMSSRKPAALAVVAAAVFWWPRPACAPAGAPAADAQQAAAPAPLQAGFDDEFFIQKAHGDNRLVFGMVAQTDGRFFIDDPVL